MTFSTRERPLPVAAAPASTAGQASSAGQAFLTGPSAAPAARLAGIALMTGSAASSQLGAATAVLAFPVLGPAGVVAVRQWVAGAVLLVTVRPRFAALTREQWRPVLALAVIFATMNLSLYVAVNTIGLGLGVTLEFLGPLSVALLASRRAVDLGCALVAGGAVVVLARPQPSTDYAGIALALLAAACWAGYILVNRVVGARIPGAQGPAAAACLSAVLYIPVGIWVLASHPVTAVALGRAAAAGLLCSAVPMVADMQALRRVPPRFYGVFMSVNPVFAALTGLVVLGQSLGAADCLAIAAIVTANAVSVGAAGKSRKAETPPGGPDGPPGGVGGALRRAPGWAGARTPGLLVRAARAELHPGEDQDRSEQDPRGEQEVDDGAEQGYGQDGDDDEQDEGDDGGHDDLSPLGQLCAGTALMTQDCRRRRAQAIGISPARTLVHPRVPRCRHRGLP